MGAEAGLWGKGMGGGGGGGDVIGCIGDTIAESPVCHSPLLTAQELSDIHHPPQTPRSASCVRHLRGATHRGQEK